MRTCLRQHTSRPHRTERIVCDMRPVLLAAIEQRDKALAEMDTLEEKLLAEIDSHSESVGIMHRARERRSEILAVIERWATAPTLSVEKEQAERDLYKIYGESR